MFKKSTPSKSSELVENRDYYLENGYFVLTESFLEQRGYCCGSGCRHCPYPKKEKNAPLKATLKSVV
ncbi:MAG: hypothetical protein RIQ78_1455 [Bacteroidota bacterium]|jgi:hypothetical protein